MAKADRSRESAAHRFQETRENLGRATRHFPLRRKSMLKIIAIQAELVKANAIMYLADSIREAKGNDD